MNRTVYNILALEGRKEGNVLFNDTLNTFYLQLYGIRHMVKDHSDLEGGNVFFFLKCIYVSIYFQVSGARCSSVVRVFAHGAMGRRIDPSWGGPIELFLVPTVNKMC